MMNFLSNQKMYLFLCSLIILLWGCINRKIATNTYDNSIHPLGTSVYGQQISGSNGDYSSFSSVYQGHGIRISPGNKAGRVYYDFGSIIHDSVTVTFQWIDNGWFSSLKTIEIFNWKTKMWERIVSWKGNDKIEHTNTYKIKIQQENLGLNKQIRIGIFASKYAVIHLDNITVK
jgi:hypothetical protein